MFAGRLRTQQGFTLGEVLIATAATTVIAGAAFALLNTSLDNHAVLSRVHRGVSQSAHVAEMIRAEVATAASVDLAKDRSLALTTSSGQRVLYRGTVQPDGDIEFNRHTVDGGGNVDGTLFLGFLRVGEQPARLDFTAVSADRVRVEMTSSDFDTGFSVGRWTEP